MELTVDPLDSTATVAVETFDKLSSDIRRLDDAVSAPGQAIESQPIVVAEGEQLLRIQHESGPATDVEVSARLSEWVIQDDGSIAGNTCLSPFEVLGTGSFGYLVNLEGFTRTVSGTISTGCSFFGNQAGPGEDVFYLVTVPAGYTLHADVTGWGLGSGPSVSVLRYEVDDNGTPGDPSDDSPTTCFQLNGTAQCLAEGTEEMGPNTSLSWDNASGVDETVLLLVDNYGISASDPRGDFNGVELRIEPTL